MSLGGMKVRVPEYIVVVTGTTLQLEFANLKGVVKVVWVVRENHETLLGLEYFKSEKPKNYSNINNKPTNSQLAQINVNHNAN